VSVLDAILVSIYGMAVVFVVLLILWAILVLFSKAVNALQPKNKKASQPEKAQQNAGAAVQAGETAAQVAADTSAGQLKLIDVDEKTAAIIMAIVSHESKIPLSELQFKSIKALD